MTQLTKCLLVALLALPISGLSFTHTVGRSAGGWGDVIISAPGGAPQSRGKWMTKGRVVYVSDGGVFEPYARYYVEANKLMFTFADGSKEIWYR